MWSPTLKAGIVGIIFVAMTWYPPVALSDALWSGKCVGISDGDTIRVMHARQEVIVRLYGIDCPEKDQDFGRKARWFTGDMVYGKTVEIREVDRDRYGRPVAWVSVDGRSLNKELVKAGLAWWYRQYAPQDTELKDLEHEARKQKIGLWSHPRPVPPWEFRKR